MKKYTGTCLMCGMILLQILLSCIGNSGFPVTLSGTITASASGNTALPAGWVTLKNGKKRYYRDGAYVTGLVKVDKKICFFDKKGYLRKNAWCTVGKKTYRTDKNGVIIRNRFVTVKKKRYLLKSNGVLYKGWKTSEEGNRYFGTDGAQATGLCEINGKTYYFDSDGIQRTGWRKVKKNYYFFRIADAKNGYMTVSKTVNGVKLQKNGKAVLTDDSKEKLALMVKANSIVDSITKPGDKKRTKLWSCFQYVTQFPYATLRPFKATKNWERAYVNDIFLMKRGNCFSKAYTFAYLANAVGYRVLAISSGNHGWAEIAGKIYDPDWTRESKVDTFFGMSYDLSGIDGRGQYKVSRNYVIEI